jgi:hypothetical protein
VIGPSGEAGGRWLLRKQRMGKAGGPAGMKLADVRFVEKRKHWRRIIKKVG